ANRLLSAAWAPYLPASAAPRSPNKAAKYAIIMTDGAQLEIDSYTQAQADAMLLSTCNNMRANGITVFTVGFALNATTQALLKRCADSDANFIPAVDETQLKAAFERIGRIVGEATARLVY
ncbi:MAG: VWA domain-containing protein, partial [Notoacmeibacter sp.]